MKCASKARLIEAFKLTDEAASRVRALAKLVDDADKLESFINYHCPQTAAYARSCHGDPFNTQIWRVTMALHAIDVLIDGNGVEGLGEGRSGDYAPPYEYVNMGDPYVQTLVYDRARDNLFIGSWGDVQESREAEDGVHTCGYCGHESDDDEFCKHHLCESCVVAGHCDKCESCDLCGKTPFVAGDCAQGLCHQGDARHCEKCQEDCEDPDAEKMVERKECPCCWAASPRCAEERADKAKAEARAHALARARETLTAEELRLLLEDE